MKRWQVVLLEIVVLILIGLAGASLPVHSAHKWSDYRPTSGRLSIAYRELNEDYFYGSLPAKDTTVIVGDLQAKEEMGSINQHLDGTWLIVIDYKSHAVEKQAEMTLLHEMCHQEDMMAEANEGIDGHSDSFQTCMISIASHGAFRNLW